MYFDTHAHLDDRAFDADRAEMLRQIREAGVKLVIDPGCEPESCRKAAALSEAYDWIYFAAGIHPEELESDTPEALEETAVLAAHPKCVAIGEIGLDYYWDDRHREEQKALFRRQIALALERELPVIVHDREAHGDCLEIIRGYPELRGVFHCFSGSAEMAEELLRRGWYLGFDGPVTYKNARKTPEVLAICPLDRILLETDSPYLSPVPRRGRRNDPGNLRYICERIAELKGTTPQTVAAAALKNGCELFGIRIPARNGEAG
ncbi:MAG: TatD family hydrolase [Oscillospiraceae bacterium]|nr:TatD family hydrolase [Oscillospiraceae bacterium]